MVDIKNYREMDCPVCNRFHFSELDETDIEVFDYIQCPHCGWKCDVKQTDNKELNHGENDVSLDQYRAHYQKKISENSDYDFYDENYIKTEHKCPICEKYTFGDLSSHEVCPICGWEDDALMEEEPDDWEGCANDLSLMDYKKNIMN